MACQSIYGLAVGMAALHTILAAEPLRILENGSIVGRFASDSNSLTEAVLDFGMPPVRPARRWREGQAHKTQWSTNGLIYTQTVLVATLPSEDKQQPAGPMTVVLINIEGENTNPEYTDAFASLSIRKQGECLSLQLTNGILLAQHANFHLTLGALEVPESGIKAAEGKRLEFYGAMPPSIKGGMTLKLPLNWPPHLIDHNRLLELDYEPAYRQAAKARTNNNPEHALLSFQPDVPPTTVGD